MNSHSDFILPHKKFTWADLGGGYKYRYPPPSLCPCCVICVCVHWQVRDASDIESAVNDKLWQIAATRHGVSRTLSHDCQSTVGVSRVSHDAVTDTVTPTVSQTSSTSRLTSENVLPVLTHTSHVCLSHFSQDMFSFQFFVQICRELVANSIHIARRRCDPT